MRKTCIINFSSFIPLGVVKVHCRSSGGKNRLSGGQDDQCRQNAAKGLQYRLEVAKIHFFMGLKDGFTSHVHD